MKKADTSKTFIEELNGQLTASKEGAQKAQDAQARALFSNNVAGPSSQPNKGEEFTTWDISMAVRDIYDMSEKTMINFIMLGDLAKAIRENKDEFMTDHLEFGFRQSALTPEIKSLFKTWAFEETDYGYRYYFTPPTKWNVKIPVEIHLFRKKWKFIDNPDKGWFGVDDFYLPNPFAEYWKVKQFV